MSKFDRGLAKLPVSHRVLPFTLSLFISSFSGISIGFPSSFHCPVVCFPSTIFPLNFLPFLPPQCLSPPLPHPFICNPSPPPSSAPCPVRDKFVEVDLKPVCKHCYERLPNDMKYRLAKRERDSKEKKKKPLIPMCL